MKHEQKVARTRVAALQSLHRAAELMHQAVDGLSTVAAELTEAGFYDQAMTVEHAGTMTGLSLSTVERLREQLMRVRPEIPCMHCGGKPRTTAGGITLRDTETDRAAALCAECLEKIGPTAFDELRAAVRA